MLGWMLRRGDDAPDAGGDGDTMQIDQPDTPAPVFAARAFKSALFGTPARHSDEIETRPMRDTAATNSDLESKTPQKPQGILLTPGTGTSRRKRVSFGQDVGKKPNDDLPLKDGPRQRTRLDDVLEKVAQRRKKAAASKPQRPNHDDTSEEEDWAEEEEDDFCQDVTIDLNEPHSQSGKYWKGEFEKYHEDAKAEMEKLLKYKQLAKSYAKQKDAEATELAEMLKEEQQRVIMMEKQIAEGASKMVSKRDDRSDETAPELLATLTKQTALAVQYRTRVQELEEQLEDFLRDKEEDSDAKSRRRRQQLTSPRTQKTLLEAQRELRRARSQVKELGELRDQVSELKSQLRSAEKRAAKAESERKADGDAPREGIRTQELRAQLREAKEEAQKKDDELRRIKKEFEAYREETKAREEDTKGVLERAHDKIADLKKEVRILKVTGAEPASRPKSWHPQAGVDLLAEAAKQPDTNVSNETSKPATNSIARRSFDIADIDEDSVVLKAAAGSAIGSASHRTLREQFHDDAMPRVTQSDLGMRPSSTALLADRPNLGRPRWQPFVPRSPRNRDYLGEEITKAIQNGGATSAATKPKEIEAPSLPSLAKSVADSEEDGPEDKIETKVDLLQNRFAPVGASGKEFLSNPKSTLPPARRAAAMARIEQRLAEKQRQRGHDKENVRP